MKMKKLLIAIALIASCTFAKAESTANLIDCSAMLGMGYLLSEMTLQSAPQYSRDKYEKRKNFFLQGRLNLLKQARKNPDFISEKDWNDRTTKQMGEIKKEFQYASAETVNESIAICISVANLRMADFPQ